MKYGISRKTYRQSLARVPRLLLLVAVAAMGLWAGESTAAPLDQRIEALMKKWRLPGASVAVVREGKLVHARGFGWADVGIRVAARAETSFRIASVSKPLTALAVLRLVEEGALTLDSPVFDYLTEWKSALGDPRMEAITIRHLLHHSGGWDSTQTGDPCFPDHAEVLAAGASFPPTHEELLAYVLAQPLEFAPGSRDAYSNFGYVLLGRVIERVTGLTYEQAVRSLVFAPLGVGGARIGLSDGNAEGLAAKLTEARYYGHPGAGLDLSIFYEEPVPVPSMYGGFSMRLIDAAGGWVSTAPELAVVLSSIAGAEDPLLSAEAAALISDRAPYDEGNPAWYGLGVNVLETPNGYLWGHAGRLDGAVSWWVRLPDNTNLVFLANSAPPEPRTDEFVAEMEEALLLGLLETTDWPEEDLVYRYIPQGPALQERGVRNLAEEEAGVAPGALVRISGSGLGPVRKLTFDGAAGGAPLELAGVSVTMGGQRIPLISVSALEIEAVVPLEMPANASVPVVVHAGDAMSEPQLLLFAKTAPAIFQRPGNGAGTAAALNADGTENSATNPAQPGSSVSLFLTGAGATLGAFAAGEIASGPGYAPLAELRALVNDFPVAITYAGAAPGLLHGVMQVNLVLPMASASGDRTWKVEVEAGGRRSAPAVIFVEGRP